MFGNVTGFAITDSQRCIGDASPGVFQNHLLRIQVFPRVRRMLLVMFVSFITSCWAAGM